MWYVSENNLQMAEGEYGLKLPVTITGTTFGAGDAVKIIFKDQKNGTTILTKRLPSIAHTLLMFTTSRPRRPCFKVVRA